MAPSLTDPTREFKSVELPEVGVPEFGARTDGAKGVRAFEELPTVEFALERLVRVSMVMTAGERPVTRADIDALAPDDRRSFDAVCAQALVLGIPRYLSPGMTIAPPAPPLM